MAVSIADDPNIGDYLIGTGVLGIWGLLSVDAQAASEATFAMKRSTGLPATCAPGAKATVKIQTLGFAEKRTVAGFGDLKGPLSKID